MASENEELQTALDERLRIAALNKAIEFCASLHHSPEDVVTIAKNFYRFLKGEDK